MYDYTWLVDDLLLLQHFGALWDNICVYVCMCTYSGKAWAQNQGYSVSPNSPN